MKGGGNGSVNIKSKLKEHEEMIGQYYRYERKGDKEGRRKKNGTGRNVRFRIRLRKVVVLFQPLKIVGAHIPHIFIPHPTLEWPTEAWNSQFLFPTKNIQPSPLLSLPLFLRSHTNTHTHTYTNTFLSSIQRTRMCPLDLLSSDTNHESRIGQAAVKGTTRERRRRRRRGWQQGGNFTRNFCYPSLTPPTILVQGPWRHLFLESARIPDIRLSCYANRYIQQSREMIRRTMNYAFNRMFR